METTATTVTADISQRRREDRDAGVVHFSAGPTIVSAGGHNTDYLGTEVRCGW